MALEPKALGGAGDASPMFGCISAVTQVWSCHTYCPCLYLGWSQCPLGWPGTR